MSPETKLEYSLAAVAKTFGRQEVFKNLNLRLRGGECVLLLGANGSGKSTLIRIAAGLLRRDAGSLKITGPGIAPSVAELGPLPLGNSAFSQLLGHFGHELMLYGSLSVSENIRFFSRLRSNAPSEESILAAWNLGSYRQKRVHELSKGLQVRVSLSRAFLHQPMISLLDEPSSALDEESVGRLGAFIGERIGKGALVVLATHDIHRMAAYANRAVVLGAGSLVLDTADAPELSSLSTGEKMRHAIDRYRDLNR